MLTPILMYHEIADPDDLAGGAAASWAVTPACFREHLAWLADEGYTGVSVEKWLQSRGGGGNERSIVFTFDDGYRGNVANAIPALAERGWSATVFVVSGMMGRDGCGTPGEWRAAREAGMDVASHTATHPFLGALPLPDVRRELLDSRLALEAAIGAEVHGLSWPNGDAPRGGESLLVECGYAWAATSRAAFAGPATGQRSLPRLAVRAWHDVAGLRRLVDDGAGNRLRMLALYRLKKLGRAVLGRHRYAELHTRIMEKG